MYLPSAFQESRGCITGLYKTATYVGVNANAKPMPPNLTRPTNARPMDA